MDDSDLLSLFGYYMGIIAFLFAFFTSKIDDWKQRVDELVNSWDPAEQKNNAVFKRQQNGKRKTLRTSQPCHALFAPIAIAGLLLGLGGFALARADASVDKLTFVVLLVLPAVVLLGIHFLHGCSVIRKQRRALDNLQNE